VHRPPDAQRLLAPAARHQKRLARELVAVLHAESLDAVKRNLKAFRLQFVKQFPEAVDCLERGFDDATAYFAFPEGHRLRITPPTRHEQRTRALPSGTYTRKET
jgi:transposase-like protein